MSEVENIIKGVLDGWFFRLDPASGKVCAHAVDKDFVPGYRVMEDAEEDEVATTAKKWSPGEDETMVRLYKAGVSMPHIAREIGVAKSTAYNRLRILLNTDSLPRRPHPNAVWTEKEPEILRMKQDGYSFSQIADALGMTRNQVAGVWARLKKQMMKEAA